MTLLIKMHGFGKPTVKLKLAGLAGSMDCNNANKNIHHVELARTFHFMTLLHISLFPMVLCMSLNERPVSDKDWSTYALAGLPLDLDHGVGSQNSSSFATSFPS